MVLLHPRDEASWAHARFSFSSVHNISLTVSFLCVSLGLVLSTFEIPLPYDNFVNKQYNLTRQRLVPGKAAYLSEAVAALDAHHPLHAIYRKNRVLRYDYGSTFFNHCTRFKLPSSWHLPSLLRLLEFRADAQYCIRTAILSAICIRMVLYGIRVLRIQGQRSSVCMSALSALSVLLELAQSTMAMLITCFQQNQDQTVKWLMPHLLPLFAVFFVSSGVLYTFVEYLDPQIATSKKLHIRIVSIIIFVCSIPTVITSHRIFLHRKPCHTHVAARDALMEYICILCVLSFALSQIGDWSQLECVLSCEYIETTLESSSDVFRPAFAYSKKFEFEPFAPLRPITTLDSCQN